jgi:manganese transport protein
MAIRSRRRPQGPDARRSRSPSRRPRESLGAVGPELVAAIAYVDPGNFATNALAGAEFGYALVWVVVIANLMAMLVQGLSAKLGLATGRSLPELCRERFPPKLTRGLWAQAEVMAMATELAEPVGGAVALNLLFGIALFPAAVITAIATLAILTYEDVIAGMLAAIVLALLYETIVSGGDLHGLAAGLLPSLPSSEAVLLATGILGATVMPHTIYFHSALTQDQATGGQEQRRRLLRVQRVDLLSAMSAAGLVNALMLIAAAGSFFTAGLTHVNTLAGAHHAFRTAIGGAAALTFALALLASGLASSTVGTYAGQVVIPFALVPLLLLTRTAS